VEQGISSISLTPDSVVHTWLYLGKKRGEKRVEKRVKLVPEQKMKA